MGHTSKDLLHLECKNLSSSSIESSLLVCNNESISQKKKPHPDEKLTTLPVPASKVIGKLEDFFSNVSKRNQLDAKDNYSEDCNIEELTGHESEYIEMDLMLGLADLRTPEAVAAAEAAVAGYQPVATSTSDTELEDSSDDDDDDDNDDDDDEDDDDNDNDNDIPTKSKSRKDNSSRELENEESRKRSKILELP